MEASPLPFSACYLNSHVNAASELGDKDAFASSLVEADYLSGSHRQYQWVILPGRCASITAVLQRRPLLPPYWTETKVHPSWSPMGKKTGKEMMHTQACSGRNIVGHDYYPYCGYGTGAMGSGWALVAKFAWVIAISKVVEICDM